MGRRALALQLVAVVLTFSRAGFLTLATTLLVYAFRLRRTRHAWLVAGGAVYTLGAAIFLAHHIRYHHALWHVMVLAGSACHFWLVLSYVLPGSVAVNTL